MTPDRRREGTSGTGRSRDRGRGGRPSGIAAVLMALVAAGPVASLAEPLEAHAADAALSSLVAPLRDQHGRPGPAGAALEKPHAVFVVSARRLRRVREWQKELDRRVEGVSYLRVADVPSEAGRPPARFEDVAEELRKRVPADVAVLVDLERRFAGRLDLDTREVNVLVFDASGAMVGRFRGRPTPAAADEATTRLLALPGVHRRAAAPPPAR